MANTYTFAIEGFSAQPAPGKFLTLNWRVTVDDGLGNTNSGLYGSLDVSALNIPYAVITLAQARTFLINHTGPVAVAALKAKADALLAEQKAPTLINGGPILV